MINQTKMLLNQAKQFCYYLIGINWILLLLYLRLKEKNAYTLMQIKESAGLLQYLLYGNFVMINSIVALAVIFSIIRKNNNVQSTIVLRFKNAIDSLYNNPLDKVRDMLAPHIPYSGEIFCKFCKILDNIPINYLKYFVIALIFIPKIIIASTFFIEILFFKELKYFFIVLGLLFFTLGWNIFINLFAHFAKSNLPTIESYLIFEPKGKQFKNGLYEDYVITMNSKYSAENLVEYAELWRILVRIKGYTLVYFGEFRAKYSPYITIFCSVLYVIAGSYRFYFILI